MAYSSYTIRAAALERLVNNIIQIFEKLCSSVSEETSYTEEELFEGFDELKRLYPNHGRILPRFPTENLEVLLRSIMTIIRMYHVFPQIHAKIEICYCFKKVVSKFDTLRKNRLLEMNELSSWFHDISQQLNGKTYNASMIFVNETNHGFHPDSEFTLCTVKFVN